MAVWHYNYYIKFNNITNQEELFKNLLEIYKTKNDIYGGIIFGDNDEQFIEVNIENGNIGSFSGGFNIGTVKREFIENFVNKLNKYDIVFKNINKKRISFNLKSILEDIRISNAYKFLTNPEEFFVNIKNKYE